MATGIKHVHKAVTRSRHLILFQRVLFSEGHEQLPVDVLNAERCIPWREAGIGKRASKLKAGSADFAGWWSGPSLGSISSGGCEFAMKRGLTSTRHSCPSRAL